MISASPSSRCSTTAAGGALDAKPLFGAIANGDPLILIGNDHPVVLLGLAYAEDQAGARDRRLRVGSKADGRPAAARSRRVGAELSRRRAAACGAHENREGVAQATRRAHAFGRGRSAAAFDATQCDVPRAMQREIRRYANAQTNGLETVTGGGQWRQGKPDSDDGEVSHCPLPRHHWMDVSLGGHPSFRRQQIRPRVFDPSENVSFPVRAAEHAGDH